MSISQIKSRAHYHAFYDLLTKMEYGKYKNTVQVHHNMRSPKQIDFIFTLNSQVKSTEHGTVSEPKEFGSDHSFIWTKI